MTDQSLIGPGTYILKVWHKSSSDKSQKKVEVAECTRCDDTQLPNELKQISRSLDDGDISKNSWRFVTLTSVISEGHELDLNQTLLPTLKEVPELVQKALTDVLKFHECPQGISIQHAFQGTCVSARK